MRDLASRNRTTVKGKRVSTLSINPGDTFDVGSIPLRVEDVAAIRYAECRSRDVSTLTCKPWAIDESVNLFLKRRNSDVTLLKPVQLDVLKLLLRGDAEEAISTALQVGKNMVHSRVKVTFKVFGVNSRSALMSEFIDPQLSDADPLCETIWRAIVGLRTSA